MLKNDIGHRLQQLRESKRPVRSRRVTSELCGLYPNALQKYERGESSPSLEAIIQLADYYEVSVGYIITGEK